jgi:hypothetical protein
MYETIVLLLLYGSEIWCLTLGEEHRLRMSDSRVFRRTSPPKKNEVIVGWKNLHKVGAPLTVPSPNVIRITTSRKMRFLSM